MFIPLYDSNQFRYIRHSYVNLALIAANVIIFLITIVEAGGTVSEADVLGLGFIPSVINDIVELAPERIMVPENFTYLTYAFLHNDLFHLGGNMIFLWVFGDNVEDAMGHVKYLLFYLLCAAAGAFLHGVILPDSEMPLIGASGAIAGVVVAYLMLHPHVKLWVLVLMRIPLRIPAWIPITLWIAFQFFMLFAEDQDGISWPAHVGGIIAGVLLVPIFKRRDVKLFSRPPAAIEPAPQAVPAEPPASAPPVRWGRQ